MQQQVANIAFPRIVPSKATERCYYVHKIASSASLILKDHAVKVRAKNNCSPGDLIAVRVITPNQNPLELGNGRMASLNQNDIVVGVLGNRRALKGFVGSVPQSINIGDKLNILNLGGVIGLANGGLQGLGAPVEVEYLGHVVIFGRYANLKQIAGKFVSKHQSRIPLVLVAGTCMNAGKTRAAAEIVKKFSLNGYKVAAAKLTGIACLRDTLFMEDYGAVKTMSFMHCGLPSTVDVEDIAPVAKTIVKKLSDASPDVIVIELGDGLLGGYNVESLFTDADLMQATAGVLLCASDFVGAWGGIELLKAKGVSVDVIAGSCTDSPMAIDYIEKKFSVAAANALNDGDKLFSIIQTKVDEWKPQQLK